MSVEFEPVRLGPRRRGMEPVALGAIVVAIALAVSVVKPWGDGSGPNDIAAAPAPSAVPTPEPAATPSPATPSPAIPRIISASTATSPSWTEIEPTVRRHESWGIRAIVRNPYGATGSPTPPYAERWFRFPAGGTQMSTALIDGGHPIVALGVTFPPSHTPLDVRIWRVGRGDPEWIDTEALDPTLSDGSFLYVRPGDSRGPAKPWGSGRYRMDVLVDGSIRRFEVTIPDRLSNIPAGSERPNLHDVRPTTDVPSVSLIDVPYGLFATADGVAMALPAEEGPPLDEAAAWLDVDPGTRRAPRSFVAEAYLPGATRLGVMLESRVIVMSANIARLSPEPLPTVVPVIDHTPRDGAPSSSVLFRAPDRGVWTPGVYRLTVVWADFDGRHEGSWHLELRPGPVRTPAHLLSAARAWARYAGDSGIVRGTAEPLEGGPRSATIRLERATSPEGAGYPLRDRLPCDGFRIDGPGGSFGVAQPVDAPPANVTARVHFEYSRSDEQPVLTASGNVPGLTLVAPHGDLAPSSDAHRSRVGEDLDPAWSTLCVQVR